MNNRAFYTSAVTIEHGWLKQTFSGTGTASWERYGNGSWDFTVRAFGGATAESLQIDAIERGTKSARAVALCLNRRQSLELRDFLLAAYGPK